MNTIIEILYLISLLSIATAIKPGCVEIYEHCGYKGKSKTICKDVPSFCKLNLDNVVSSVKVGKGTKITLFADDLYLGKRVTFTSSISCLVKVGFNDAASSARVTFTSYKNESKVAPLRPLQGCVLVFQHCHYRGKWEQVCNNLKNLDDVCMENMVSSIKIGHNARAKLYDSRNYAGKSVTKYKDDKCLVDDNFNDKASSIKVWKRNTKKPVRPKPKPRKKEKVVIPAVKVRTTIIVPPPKTIKPIKVLVTPPHREKPLIIKSLPKPRKKKTMPVYVVPAQVKAPKKANPGCIIIFEHIKYKGRWAHVCGSIKNLAKIKFGNNISSIKVGTKTKVILYSKVSYKGKSKAFTRNTLNFVKAKFNDAASSLRLYTYRPKPKKVKTVKNQKRFSPKIKKAPFRPHMGCVIIFEHAHNKGRWAHVCGSVKNLNIGRFNNRISSVKVGRRTKIVLYSGINFTGKTVLFTKDVSNLAIQGFNDKASSFKVYVYRKVIITTKTKTKKKKTVTVLPANIKVKRPRAKCVRLFELANYKGRSILLCGSKSDFRKVGALGFNDKASSVLVGKSTMVVLYEHILYQGKKVSISKNEPNFANRGWLNNKSSSAKVYYIKRGRRYEVVLTIRARLVKKVYPRRKPSRTYSLVGRFKNALNGKYIRNIKGLRIIAQATNGKKYLAKIVGNRYMFKRLKAGKYQFAITKKGWIGYKLKRTVTSVNSRKNGYWDFTISPTLKPTQWRIVLTWSSVPKDLDSTLVMPNRKEIVNFRKRKSKDRAAHLDTDNRRGFGPETITINKNKISGTKYFSYFVHNYSKRPSITVSGAKVALYHGNKVVRTWSVPKTGKGLYWHVFNLNKNGAVNINKIVKGRKRSMARRYFVNGRRVTATVYLRYLRSRKAKRTTKRRKYTFKRRYFINGKEKKRANYLRYYKVRGVRARIRYYVNGRGVSYKRYAYIIKMLKKKRTTTRRTTTRKTRTTTRRTTTRRHILGKRYYINGRQVTKRNYNRMRRMRNKKARVAYYVDRKHVSRTVFMKYYNLMMKGRRTTTRTKIYYVNGRKVSYSVYLRYKKASTQRKIARTYYLNGKKVSLAQYQKYLKTRGRA